MPCSTQFREEPMTETAPVDGRSPEEAAPPPAAAARRDTGLVRALKVLVIVLGVLLILGFFTIIARLVYLAARSSPPASAPAAGTGVKATLELPAGANVRAIALSGDRLAVHYDAPSGAAIAVLDTASGRTLARIELHGPGSR
jgi:hypothetical protein